MVSEVKRRIKLFLDVHTSLGFYFLTVIRLRFGRLFVEGCYVTIRS